MEQEEEEGGELKGLLGVKVQLSPHELREHYNTYKDDELKSMWEKGGFEIMTIMQLASMGLSEPLSASTLPEKVRKKIGKLKTNEIIDMQELMVDELKKFT